MIGHLLYLDIHALGHGATGVGCFEDNPMRSLWVHSYPDLTPMYHIAVGAPLHDQLLFDDT